MMRLIHPPVILSGARSAESKDPARLRPAERAFSVLPVDPAEAQP